MKKLLIISAIILAVFTSCEKWCDCETIGETRPHNEVIFQQLVDSMYIGDSLQIIDIVQPRLQDYYGWGHTTYSAYPGIWLKESVPDTYRPVEFTLTPEEDHLRIDYTGSERYLPEGDNMYHDSTTVAVFTVPYEFIDSVTTCVAYFGKDTIPPWYVHWQVKYKLGSDYDSGSIFYGISLHMNRPFRDVTGVEMTVTHDP